MTSTRPRLLALAVSNMGPPPQSPNLRLLPVPRKGTPMTIRNLAALAALTFLAFPLAAHAQSGGAAAGATTGAVGGAIVGGPVGAVVGGVGGAIVGGLAVSKRSRSARFLWGHLLRGARGIRRSRLSLHSRE